MVDLASMIAVETMTDWTLAVELRRDLMAMSMRCNECELEMCAGERRRG